MAEFCEMLVVSGPNGAGKTTLAEVYAAELGYPYLGADKIAESLAPDDPVSQRVSAGRQFSDEVRVSVERRQSLVVESTLSGRSFLRTFKAAHQASFFISLVHLFLDSADTCIARIVERVQKGGHDVPEVDVRRRFSRSAANFWHLYRPLCDRWILVYNAETEPQTVAEGDPATHSIGDRELFASFMQIVQAHD